MLKSYNDRSFIGGTDPFFGNLRQLQKAQEDSLTSKIIDDVRCVTSQNIMHEKLPESYEIDSDDETCLKIKKKYEKLKKTETVTVSKAVSRDKWKESNSGLSEDERKETRGNKRVKGSADLKQAIYNAKRDHKKMNLIDNGYEEKCLN